MTRRDLLAASASSVFVGCNKHSRSDHSEPSVDASLLRIRVFRFRKSPVGPQRVVVLVPRWLPPGGKFPLLIALHGRGEAHKGLEAGAWGWINDYHLDRTVLRLRNGGLTTEDLAGVGTPTYLASLNEHLTAQPFKGLVVACPFTPDIITSGKLQQARPFSDFVHDLLIPRLNRELPALVDVNRVGIDGVSLGGRMALLTSGFRPGGFRAVGTMQAAFRPAEIMSVARLLSSTWQSTKSPKHLRILSSTGDPFLPTLRRLRDRLEQKGIRSSWRVVPGPHDYAFNQGPGGYEMLLWHDRVLRTR